jgi:hypothetical protein
VDIILLQQCTCVYNIITDANSIIICQYNWIRCTFATF